MVIKTAIKRDTYGIAQGTASKLSGARLDVINILYRLALSKAYSVTTDDFKGSTRKKGYEKGILHWKGNKWECEGKYVFVRNEFVDTEEVRAENDLCVIMEYYL